jgi:hypothetical protein
MSEEHVGQLDAAIAREVMGFSEDRVFSWQMPPPYSSRIECAWVALEKVRQDEDLLTEFTCALRDGLDAYEKERTSGHSLDYFLLRDMTPEAICRAALAAVRCVRASG